MISRMTPVSAARPAKARVAHVVCRRCQATGELVQWRLGHWADPDGWIVVSVRGPVKNFRLCPACALAHAVFISGVRAGKTIDVPPVMPIAG